jgi:tRNA (guanine26-N2/guanine27-N2)-dimethyltransferase
MQEAGIILDVAQKDVVRKDSDVFYNPLMRHNRDVSLAIIETFDLKKIALPLAGSGIRAVRILKFFESQSKDELWQKELRGFKDDVRSDVTQSDLNLQQRMQKELFCNDKSDVAVLSMRNHFERNGLAQYTHNISKLDANEFLRTKKWDYIDIDPFGSPNPFLDTAVTQIKRGGILAITATDTAPLCGTYPKACLRKYWAVNTKHYMCQEIGLRILIRKVQLIGTQYDKALMPVFAYSKDHYMRVYFKVSVGKEACDLVLSMHQPLYIDKYRFSLTHFENAKQVGPLYVGPLFDIPQTMFETFFEKLESYAQSPSEKKWCLTIKHEAKENIFGYYRIHSLAELLNINQLPPLTENLGIRTVFNHESIRTNMSFSELSEILRVGKNRLSDR